jgi:hypothetical protein
MHPFFDTMNGSTGESIIPTTMKGAIAMSNENDAIETAASKLTDAMSGLVRAIDAMADEAAAARAIPEELPEELERLAARLSAVRGFLD